MKAKEVQKRYYETLRHKSWHDVDGFVDEIVQYLIELESRVVTETREVVPEPQYQPDMRRRWLVGALHEAIFNPKAK